MRMTVEDDNQTPHQVMYPACTWDYHLVKGPCGLGVAANRKMLKGTRAFDDSFEFMFADVRDGDILRFERNKLASKRGKTEIPDHFQLTRDVLLRTHGVPVLTPDPTGITAGTISWRLEVPGMLMNHSCDPTVRDTSHNAAKGEALTQRKLKKGDEITCDYVLQYYDHGPFFEVCKCGAKNCRGSMMGFKALSREEKERLLPQASEAVQAMHHADMGTGPPVVQQQLIFSDRTILPPPKTGETPLRLVVPGPSNALAPVEIKLDEASGEWQLIANQKFEFGDKVYDFWSQDWPHIDDKPALIDMVFSSPLTEGDPPEGTILRMDPEACGASRDREGRFRFSAWDLLTKHSCDPNLVYNDWIVEDEEDDWHATYAARVIKKGEVLTTDWNALLWDRACSDGTCSCGSPKCRGTNRGFVHLTADDQDELKNLTWRRVPPPYRGERDVFPGQALSPHVRVTWRSQEADRPPATESSGSSSSSSSSSSSEDE